ncbi:Succinate dehydrogenase assembly factor 1, mitochondrial [Teratosphaeria destructans]|uniref:Succinate dehydrogenase assembly factor 1, mitochondrial n=1 Tax=Teratosphaeria destructans TaxID=418781 RepID=A0A9W7SY56_9PEZI|nr:Succinate dehydrogenase assembly factor 1, mitochondrial [Teratosphaeria destructans]
MYRGYIVTSPLPLPLPGTKSALGITSPMPRLSGLQRDVLHLYRRCLRACRTKPADTRTNFEDFARREFERHIHMDKKDFGTIEFLLRKGNRQLEIYESPGVTNIAG